MYLIFTVRPIENLQELVFKSYLLPEILFKTNARILEVSCDQDDPRVLPMMHNIACNFGLHLYLYDPHFLFDPSKVKFIPTVYSYDNLYYYLGGTSTPILSNLVGSTEGVTYDQVKPMKNGFSQLIEVSFYKFIRYYNADGRSTTTIMDLDGYLTNSWLCSTFEQIYGVFTDGKPVVNFKNISVLPVRPKPEIESD